MFTTKIRTTAVMLAAAITVGVASGPIAPDAHAAKNDGRYQTSAEAKRKQWDRCATLKASYTANVEAAIQIEGNPDDLNLDDDEAAKASEEADAIQDAAKAYGCGWAA